jgi:hypothetical protein
MRTNLLRGPLRSLSLAGFLLGLAPATQAFTIISFEDPTVRKVSVGSPPADGPSQTSTGPRYSVSDNGRFIVFTSRATNLLAGQVDGNGANDVFLFDTSLDRVIALVSHASGAALTAADAESDQPVISPGGNFVVFRSRARDILPAGAAGFTGQANVFLWDIVADTYTLVSRDSVVATTAGDDDSQNGVISRGAGRPLVAFESLATNLLPPGTDENGVSDVYRFNSSTGLVNLVSKPNPPVVESNGASVNPAIDSSGDCVVYQSLADNLVSNDPGNDMNTGGADVFRWKQGADPATILLSHQPGSGVLTGTAPSSEPSVDDGCAVFAFKSLAKEFAPSDGNGKDDVFHERDGGDAVLASHSDGLPNQSGNGASVTPILSRDGNWIAYASEATDLSPGQFGSDTNGTSDVFVYDISKEESTLVSHAAGDPKVAADGKSDAPEISTNGLYVAFVSDAKNIDPNQNDGNGTSDVFLHNRRWNNAVLASRRFSSIAIAGNRRSVVPALSGNGYTVAFTSEAFDLIADDPETGGLDDVFFFRSLGLWPFVSVRSSGSQNVLEWITPATNYWSMEVKVTPTTPCDSMQYSDVGWTPLAAPVEPANSSLTVPFTDPIGYPLGTTRCYGIFIRRDGDTAGIPATAAPATSIEARTLEPTAGPAVKWASNVAGLTALGQVGIGAGNLIAVANDGGVYGITRGPTGGLWSSGYWPFRTNFSPIQGRPGVLTLSVMGSTHTVFVGSQDGRVYALDADLGAHRGGTLWYTTPALGPAVQSGVAGMFTFFGGVGDHLLVGTRPSPGLAQFFALDPTSGAPRAGSPFIGSIGAINTSASVDYARAQVYFASQEFTAIQPSLWCLKLTASGLGSTCWAPQTLPFSISGGPIERNGTLYAGDDLGQVWAFSATAGTQNWAVPYVSCGGGAAVKSFVLADRLGIAQDLYYATSAQLCAVTDLGGTAATKWSISTIPGPSAPVLVRILGVAYLFVGSSDGRLYQVEADNPAAIKSVLLRAGATIGAAAFDFRDNMVYVGSTAGAIYAVQVPLP